MMTPEKSTMADVSGGKRDRRSDNTDDPVTTPNTRDAKLSCWDPNYPNDTAKDKESIEDDTDLEGQPKITLIHPPAKKIPDDEPMSKGLTLHKGVDIIDVDAFIASGGAEPGYDTDFPAHSPKKLFFSSDEDEASDDDAPEDDQDKYAAATTDFKPTEETKLTNKIITQNTEKTNLKNTEKEENNNKNKNNNIDSKPSSITDPSTEFSIVTYKNPQAILDLSTLKPHTGKWKGLNDFARNLGPFIITDKSFVETAIARTLVHLKKNKDLILSRDDWVKIFQTTITSRGKNTSKFIKILGARLALSDPKEFFLPHELNAATQKLLPGRIANAWAGAYTLYGPGWVPEIIISLDISNGIKEPTPWWKTLSDNDVKNILPFGPDDIFSEENSMHDLERHLKNKFEIRSGRTHVDPRQWLEAFTAIQDTAGPARDALIKLALTPISIFASHSWFHDDAHTQLLANSMTNFWTGAYLLVGGPWAITDAEMDEAATTPESSTKAKPLTSNLKSKVSKSVAAPPVPVDPQDKGVSFGAGVKSRSLFLSRGPRKIVAVKAKPKADKRKFEDVYYSVELPPIDSDWKESGAELTAQFAALVEHILNKDKKALIHQWDSPGGALSKKSVPVKSKQQARRFVNNSLFTRQGFETKIRIRVSHDVLPTLLEVSSSESGMTVEHDHIQEKERSVIGFLVGSCPEATNLADMRTSHENHSVLFGLKILCEERSVNLASQALKIPFKLQTKAIHILVGAKQAVDARDRYNRVFGSRNEGGFPQGLHMRFVPDIADARFPTTPNTRMKAVKMLSKQKAFLDNTKVISTSTIAGVHTVIKKIGFSLCEILMAIKSHNDKEMGLFIAIDEQDQDGAYTTLFTVHKDRFEEASGLIPLFCILYVAKFGEAAWEWFTEEAKVVLLKYKWDPAEGQVMPLVPEEDEELDLDSDDEYFTTMADLLNIDTSATASKGFIFDLDYLIDDPSPSKNQFGDTGSVKTFRDACLLDTVDDSEAESVVDLGLDDASAGSFEVVHHRSTSPVECVETDAATQATSTLSDDTSANVASSLEQLMLQNPALAKELYLKNSSQLSSTSVAVSPTEGVDGN